MNSSTTIHIGVFFVPLYETFMSLCDPNKFYNFRDIVEHEFKVGGKWKYVMLMPNGNEFISEGVYKLIVEFQKIFSSANFRPMTEGVEIQALFEKNGKKKLILLLMLSIQQKSIVNNRRKWDFIMDGDLRLTGWKQWWVVPMRNRI